MKITCNQISNVRYVQIYLSKDEINRQEIKKVIEKYKKDKYSVAIFITGKENYPEILKKIIKTQVKLNYDIF